MIEHLAINTPYFGILLSLIPFIIATLLFKKTKGFFLFTPLFVSMVVGIAFLKLTGIDYANYKIGGDIINFFLEPATICFAIPLYKRRDVLKKYWKQVLGGITLGTTAALICIYLIAEAFQFSNGIIAYISSQCNSCVSYNYNNKVARIGATTTTITPTMTNEMDAIDASVSPNSCADDTPRECPLVPSARPRAIGLVILNNLISFVPKA